MFEKKIIISTTIFLIFLIITSVIKNKTRIIEKKISNYNVKILIKKKDINESQLDFYYLTSPKEIEKKLNKNQFNSYKPIKFSNIFLNISDFTKIQNKISDLKIINEKKIQEK